MDDLSQQVVPDVSAKKPRGAALWENVKAILGAVFLAFLIRSFVVEPFKIPSSSMVPTLAVGDHIFVNKFHYGLRLPFTKWWPLHLSQVERGDVVVFIYPVDESLDFIKRVVALPGDEVRVVGHDLYVNGAQLPHEEVDAAPDDTDGAPYRYYREQHGERAYVVRYERRYGETERTFHVPEGTFFVMGDNRDNSQDSREWGAVPFAHLKGKAMFIWISRDYTQSIFSHGIRWHRFGMGIK